MACTSCETELSNSQVCYSDGICPECGHNSHGTIVDHKKIVFREIHQEINPWWKIWLQRYAKFVDGKTVDDDIWLLQNDYPVYMQ
jgi:hypothetical protein